jgi:Tol biopolymer transport system component
VLALSGCGGGGGSAGGEELIAFGTNRGHGPEVYVMRPDGTGVRRVVAGIAPKFSPDGKLIAFSRGPDGVGDLFVVGVDGKNVRRVAKADAAFPLGWVEDEIVYLACGGTSCDLRQGTRTFARNQRLRGQSFRGDSVAHVRNGDVYVNEKRLTTGTGNDYNPVWSPDGEQLVFTSDRDRAGRCLYENCAGFAPEIYVMNSDGSDQTRLTASTAVDVQPAWSPGGKRIVWARSKSENDDYELWVMNADGSCQTRLTDNRWIDWLPSWAGPSETDSALGC